MILFLSYCTRHVTSAHGRDVQAFIHIWHDNQNRKMCAALRCESRATRIQACRAARSCHVTLAVFVGRAAFVLPVFPCIKRRRKLSLIYRLTVHLLLHGRWQIWAFKTAFTRNKYTLINKAWPCTKMRVRWAAERFVCILHTSETQPRIFGLWCQRGEFSMVKLHKFPWIRRGV